MKYRKIILIILFFKLFCFSSVDGVYLFCFLVKIDISWISIPDATVVAIIEHPLVARVNINAYLSYPSSRIVINIVC